MSRKLSQWFLVIQRISLEYVWNSMDISLSRSVITSKALVTNAITNCYERRTNDFQTMEIREDNGKTGRFVRTHRSFVRTFVTVALFEQNITDDARCEAEIKRRIEIARNTFLAMKGLLTNRKVTFALRLRLVNCYVWSVLLSVLLYGAETWTINKAMENRITSFEMWIYRRMMKISWKRMKTNKEILHMTGRKQIALVLMLRSQRFVRTIISYESPCFSIIIPNFHCLKIVRTAFVAVRNGICDRGFGREKSNTLVMLKGIKAS